MFGTRGVFLRRPEKVKSVVAISWIAVRDTGRYFVHPIPLMVTVSKFSIKSMRAIWFTFNKTSLVSCFYFGRFCVFDRTCFDYVIQLWRVYQLSVLVGTHVYRHVVLCTEAYSRVTRSAGVLHRGTEGLLPLLGQRDCCLCWRAASQMYNIRIQNYSFSVCDHHLA